MYIVGTNLNWLEKLCFYKSEKKKKNPLGSLKNPFLKPIADFPLKCGHMTDGYFYYKLNFSSNFEEAKRTLQ